MIQILIIFYALISTPVKAELWLGSRYAQNCAGCHAPGRINTEPKSRKCSLSCQGCHVNPNGGGLRSHYGKWTENKWLRTMNVAGLKQDLNFAPRKDQIYGKKPWESIQSQVQEPTSSLKSKIINQGLPLVETKALMNEPDYGVADNPYTVIASTEEQYLYQVPQKDPWREMGLSKVDAGGDFRWMVNSFTDKVPDGVKKRSQNFLMAGDISVRSRPFYRNFHIVYESRILGNPSEDALLKDAFNNLMTRNAYVMYDNIPYNTFIMAGLYRPIFGNSTPDHNALGQRLLAAAQGISGGMYKAPPFTAMTLGTAPNVPFANVHLITGTTDKANWQSQSGYGANLGLRFVSFGAAGTYSFQKTKGINSKSEEVISNLHSLGVAATLARTTATYEAMSYSIDNKQIALKVGGTHNFDTYTRVFGETYLNLAFASGNVAIDLSPGESYQIKAGIRSFVLSGVDVQLAFESTESKSSIEDEIKKTYGITSQLHLYF